MSPGGPGSVDEEAFSYLATGDGRVFVRWQGRPVAAIAGHDAARLIAQLQSADAPERQKLLARATGNFKRGNESSHR